jgi:ABC-type branched-subunit amino acid transport system substrate-binding protein
LRDVLGPDVVLLGGEGFTRGKEVLAAAGDGAQGMFAGIAGTPPERLGPAGRRFIREFDRARPAYIKPDYFWAPYAAQATEVMLDAIKASDGTRASVIQQLRSTRVRGGVLGNFRFDKNGDITPAAMTILRVERGGDGFTRLGEDFAEGTKVEEVIESDGH